MKSLELDTLIGIPEAAKLAGVPVRTMRRRLLRLDQKLRSEGNTPLLIRFGERVWKVRAEALRVALYTKERAQAETETQQERIDAIESRVAHVDGKVDALRNSYLAEKRRQKERWELQQRVNARILATQADLQALSSM